jgi:hypothetical protein
MLREAGGHFVHYYGPMHVEHLRAGSAGYAS